MLRNHPIETNDDISVFGHLAMRQTEFEDHPFFQFLARDPSPEWLRDFVPRLGFWAHVFQDVLALVERRVKDPEMRSIAHHIRGGDIGHERWLCNDMQRVGQEIPDLPAIFGPEHEEARMASYSLLAEVFLANDERLLVVYLLALEAASYVFFDTMTGYLERAEYPIELQYFGRNHLDAELNHGIVEAEMDIKIENAIEQASRDLRHEAHALINRVFTAFNTMFHSFVSAQVATVNRPLVSKSAHRTQSTAELLESIPVDVAAAH